MIYIGKNIYIFEDKIKYRGIRSSKPGGQNVNKVSTGIHLQYNIYKHKYPDWFIIHLKKIAGKSISNSGLLNIKAVTYRTQSRNRAEALKRMIDLFHKSVVSPKKRIKTKPPLKTKESRLESKRRRSQKKQLRKLPKLDD